jgi:hypothetical protein
MNAEEIGAVLRAAGEDRAPLEAEIKMLRAALKRTTDKLGEFVREHDDPGADAHACLWEARQILSGMIVAK